MPSISTMLYPAPGYVRVEANWADVNSATGAAVYRVDCLTGERVPLRPYVSFNGDFLDLSCGYGIWWDTEPQLDRCVYYCTQAINAAGDVVTSPAAATYQDTFTRTVVNGWGSADTGQTYQLVGGTVPGDYDVTAGRGTFTITTNGVPREAIVTTVNEANGFLYGFYQHPVVPTGAGHEMDVRVRRVDGSNFLDMRIFINTTNTIQAVVRQVVAGVESNVVFSSTLTNASGGNILATDPLKYRIDFWGSILRAKVWKATDPEPATYAATTAVTFLDAGTISYIGLTSGGSTNALPITLLWDNHLLTDPCATATPIEVCSSDVTVPSSGDFRFGDPVRPCNDVTLLLVGGIDPDCVPTQGIFFGSMDPAETYAANSGAMMPVNDAYPIAVSRTRRAVVSALTVVSRTFADRDAVLNLMAPGSPQLLRGPAQYGIPDRYLLAADVAVERHMSDHRIQPRSISIPHAAVRRPSGPSQGVCGARVRDLCDIYTSWDAMKAAGLTWADLLRGKASTHTPIPDTVERTWNDVNATYANWTAVNSGNTDWDDLRDGA